MNENCVSPHWLKRIVVKCQRHWTSQGIRPCFYHLTRQSFPIDSEKGKSEIFTRTDHTEKIWLLISHFELPNVTKFYHLKMVNCNIYIRHLNEGQGDFYRMAKCNTGNSLMLKFCAVKNWNKSTIPSLKLTSKCVKAARKPEGNCSIKKPWGDLRR